MNVQLEDLNRYRVENVLGGGGMAVVYLAHDEELDRPVAIKVLADNLAADEAFRKRFLREARLAARLAHPNIVRIYDSGEADGRPYIVMEHVEGETLADLLARRGKLPPDEVIELAQQVCSGLEHAHQEGLVHRDIKPENLLLRQDGTVKIVDFGIARSSHGTQLTEAGSVLGTAAYLAPEQASGEEVTPAADVYALGVVLYQLMAGRTPYSAESLTQLHAGHEEQPIPALREFAPEVPEHLEDVVMRCLARLPAYRPPSAAALAQAVSTGSSELPTVPIERASDGADAATIPYASPTAIAEVTTSRSGLVSSGRLTVAGIAAGAVLLGVGGFLVFRDDSDSPPPEPPPAQTPAEQARDFSTWLREHSGG